MLTLTGSIGLGIFNTHLASPRRKRNAYRTTLQERLSSSSKRGTSSESKRSTLSRCYSESKRKQSLFVSTDSEGRSPQLSDWNSPSSPPLSVAHYFDTWDSSASVQVRLLPREQWRSPKVGRPRGSHVAEAAAVPSQDPILGPEEEGVEAELETGPAETGSEDEETGERPPGKSSPRKTATGEGNGKPNGAPRVGIGTAERGEREGESNAEGGKKQGERVPTGEVVGIVQRAARDYVACLQKDDEASLGESGLGDLGSPRLQVSRWRSALC